MELIYTDANKQDIGIVDCASLDYDAADEKDFILTVEAGGTGLEKGSMWYVYGTEYMGIIEAATVDSANDNIEYSGTATRGMLAKRIITGTQPTRFAAGNAADIVNDWLAECDIDDLFEADETDIVIGGVYVKNFSTLYDAIKTMLDSENAIPTFTIQSDRKVHIGIDLNEDLSEELQYTGRNSFSLVIEDKGNAINHCICFAREESGQLYRIDLFTDENGGIKPYALVDTPIKDSQYILDQRNKQIFGIDERVMVIEDSVEVTENYELTEVRPSDWETNYADYYTQGESGEYEEIKPVEMETYTILKDAAAPKDWNDSFTNYYIHSGYDEHGQPTFDPVTADTIDHYALVSTKPEDWDTNYGVYYERSWDGTKYIWSGVSGIQKDRYTKQTAQPSDWAANFGSYYCIKNKNYIAVVGTGKNKNKAPKWAKNKYYTKSTYDTPPKFDATKHGKISYQTTQVPAWRSSYYYSRFIIYTAPSWQTHFYYKKHLDHYAAMITKALEQLKEAAPSQKASMKIQDYACRIGDIVGCTDEKSGITINEKVSNIIMKVNNNGVEEYDYDIGGE